MTDVETRLRATLHAVAEATRTRTDTEIGTPYVEGPGRRTSGRRPLLLLAAAVAVVVGAAVTALPDDDEPAPRLTPATRPAPPGPEGGRVLDEGTIGDEHWVLYGVDRLPGMDESPCFKLVVGTREHTPGGCGFDTGGDHRITWFQLGPAVEGGGDVLVLAVTDDEVERVKVTLAGSGRWETVAPLPDPAHPAGARYLLYRVPRLERSVELEFLTAGGMVLRVSEVRVDGPVGG